MMWLQILLNLSFAGSIGIQTTTDLDLYENNHMLKVQGSIEVKNVGNEMAQAVNIEILEPKISNQLAVVGIAPGGQSKWEIESVNIENKGSQASRQVAVVFLINYQDANGYHFSAPSVVIARFKNQDSAIEYAPKVTTSIQAEGDGEYSVRYQIKNDSNAKLILSPSLVLPKELQLVTREAPIEIEKNSEASVSYQVAKAGAIEGSRYNIFLLLRWQDQEGLRAQSFVDSLEIRGKTKIVLNWKFEDWALITLLIIAGILTICLYRDWIVGVKKYK